jgi:hypothetical protein
MPIRIRVWGIFLTLNTGSEMGKIRIRDKHPESATLLKLKQINADLASTYRTYIQSTFCLAERWIGLWPPLGP